MGTLCGVTKKAVEGPVTVLQPVAKPKYRGLPSHLDCKLLCIGSYLLESTSNSKTKKRTAKWTAEVNTYSHACAPLEEADQETLRRRVLKGPPQAFRWQAWTALRKLSHRVSESAYVALSCDSEAASQIAKDVPRTFPEHPYCQSPQGQLALYRLLSKFACKHPEIGYCQGLNYVAGLMLLVSGGCEVESFYLLEELMDTMHLSGLYTGDLPYLKKCMFVLAKLLHTRLPKVSASLEAHGISESSWMAKWFMSLFVCSLPLGAVLRVWDHLMVEGVLALFKTALALLSMAQEELISLEGLAEFFAGLRQRPLDGEKLVAKIDRLKFTHSHLRSVEKLYRPEPPPQTLSPQCTQTTEFSLPHLSRDCTLSTFDSGQMSTLPPVDAKVYEERSVLAREILEDWLKSSEDDAVASL